MSGNMNGAILYALVAAAIIYLFSVRRRKLTDFTRAQFPELDGPGFEDLRLLLKTAYERMLYLGVSFVPLAVATYHESGTQSKIFFLILIIFLFISNIGPRHKIIELLDTYALSLQDLKARGVVL